MKYRHCLLSAAGQEQGPVLERELGQVLVLGEGRAVNQKAQH